jgi:elongation factor P
MLNYNELKPGKYIVFEGQPYVVVDFQFLRMQQRKPVAQTKIKNLISGKTIDKTFQQNDKLEEAEIETKQIKYLYNNRGEFWFCEENNPSTRFSLSEDMVGKAGQFIKANSLVDAVIFDEKIFGLKPPIKVELVVKEAPPAVKGNTAQGGTKQITLETGAIINAPMFINPGDIIRVNTETGEYTDRAEKA